jgi:hypothetical protein
LGVWLACVLGWKAHAHSPSTAWLRVDVGESEVRLAYEAALADFDAVLELDSDGDGRLTWGEVQDRQSEIESALKAGLKIQLGGQAVTPVTVELLVDPEREGGLAVLRWTVPASRRDSPELEVRADLLMDVDALHRLLVKVSWEGGTVSTAVLSPESREARFEAGKRTTSLVGFVREGVVHILEGYDHLAFLLALLLPAVFRRGPSGWQPAEAWWPVLGGVLKVVTAFTVAHSVTLALGTLGWVRLPSLWVEAVIAASIGVAAVGNLWVWWRGGDRSDRTDRTDPSDRSDRSAWLMALGFGLVHGFGFAGVLGDLGVSGVAMAGPLLGFNAGVELGQVACVALFLPAAYLARRTRFYRVGVLATGSFVLLGLAGFWFVERAFAAGPG